MKKSELTLLKQCAAHIANECEKLNPDNLLNLKLTLALIIPQFNDDYEAKIFYGLLILERYKNLPNLNEKQFKTTKK